MRFHRAATMYPEGSVLDIQFPAERLNDLAGDPYWIDLTVEEAKALYDILRTRFEADTAASSPDAERPTLTLS